MPSSPSNDDSKSQGSLINQLKQDNYNSLSEAVPISTAHMEIQYNGTSDDVAKYYPGSTLVRTFSVLNIGIGGLTSPKKTCTITNNFLIWPDYTSSSSNSSTKLTSGPSGEKRISLYNTIGLTIISSPSPSSSTPNSTPIIRLHQYNPQTTRDGDMSLKDRKYEGVDLYFETVEDSNTFYSIITHILRRSSSPLNYVPYGCSGDTQSITDSSHEHTTNIHAPSSTSLDTLTSDIDPTIQHLPSSVAPSPKRSILCIVNPVGGPGEARKIAESVRPILDKGVHGYSFYETTFMGDCKSLLADINRVPLHMFDTIAVFSGDGLLSEAFNGIMLRSDWREFLETTKFAHIPAGSGNGLASCVAHISQEPFSPVSAIFLMLKGSSRRFDAFSVTQPGYAPNFGFLSISWAMISDADFESEKWRWCGSARFTFAGLLRIICLRKYKASMQFLRASIDNSSTSQNTKQDDEKIDVKIVDATEGADGDANDVNETTAITKSSSSTEQTSHHAYHANHTSNRPVPTPRCMPDCSVCGPGTTYTEMELFEKYVDYIHNTNPALSSYPHYIVDDTTDSAKDVTAAALKKDVDNTSITITAANPIPNIDKEEWEDLSCDDITLVWGMNVTHAAKGMYTAPNCHLGGGVMDLVYTRNIGCCSLLDLMTSSIETGTHVDNPKVQYVPVKGFRLDPTLAERECIISLDGERIPHAPIEVRIWRKIINIICK